MFCGILTIASVSSSASQVSSHWSVLGSILFPAARNLGEAARKEMLEIGRVDNKTSIM